MTEDRAPITVSTDAVFIKYRQATDAEIGRLRHSLAQAEAAIDSLIAERDDARRQLTSASGRAAARPPMPRPAREGSGQEGPPPGLPPVPELLDAGQR